MTCLTLSCQYPKGVVVAWVGHTVEVEDGSKVSQLLVGRHERVDENEDATRLE